jgi:hypothetical protein
MLLTAIPIVDEVMQAHASALGGDYVTYRNHAYRVANLCRLLADPDPQQMQKVAIAAAFHDLGIWTAGTFDYLAPSIALASAYLARIGRAEWALEVTAMIGEHHKLSASREPTHWLVEPFRRADWVDVSRGLLTFGLPRRSLAAVFAAWPNAGLHRRLVQLTFRRLRSHPLSPLPMLRL